MRDVIPTLLSAVNRVIKRQMRDFIIPMLLFVTLSGHMHDGAQFGMPPPPPHGDMMHPPPPPQAPNSASSTPDTTLPPMQSLEAFAPMPPRSMAGSFTQQMQDNSSRPPDVTDWLS